MALTLPPFLRKVILADAIVSGAAAFLMIAGAGMLGPLLSLPAALLSWAGISLVPFVILLFAIIRRGAAPRLLVLDVAIVNILWAAASFAVLAAGVVSPNLPSVLFVAAQALVVAVFALLQLKGLRSAPLAA